MKKLNQRFTKTDPLTRKVLFLLFVLFFITYLKVKPYTGEVVSLKGLNEYIFGIYQFIINQTLGIVHEGGHGICYLLPCPRFVMVINGTLFQWLFPLGIAWYYKRRGNMSAFYIGIFILGISADYTAWYMSTAHEGPFVPAAKSFLGVDGLHDFYYIFSTLGLLPYASLISGITKIVAMLLMLYALIGMFFNAFTDTES